MVYGSVGCILLPKSLFFWKRSKRTPTLLVFGDNRFRIMKPPIGKTSDGLQVYKAACMEEDGWLMGFFCVTFAHIEKEPVGYQRLKMAAEKSMNEPNNMAVVGINEPFVYDGYYCVVFPYIEMGSIRTCLKKFPNGILEKFVITALRTTLFPLKLVHSWGEVHGEISAGHVFLDDTLGPRVCFGANVFDLYADDDEASQYLPMASICEWGAAPEVYSDDAGGAEQTEKGDIWLVGIMALELAYGGLKVKNRQELLSLVRNAAMELRTKGFSKWFINHVVLCLAVNPAERPNASDLEFQMNHRLRDEYDYMD